MRTESGAVYLRPDSSQLYVARSENLSVNTCSANAFGIIVSLFVLAHLAAVHDGGDNECLTEAYRALRDTVHDHPEAMTIFEALD